MTRFRQCSMALTVISALCAACAAPGPQVEIRQSFLADAMALGFERSGQGEDFSIVHTGGTWGSTAVLLAYPERGQAAVIMTNSATGSVIRFEILLAIAIEYGLPLVQK